MRRATCLCLDTAMLHLVKLAVGARDLDQLAAWVESRGRGGAPVAILTRNTPRRAEEMLRGGGSLYWVVAGAVAARQRILGIGEGARPDGTACARIEMAPDLVRVVPRRMRAFQGWRYLEAEKAPPDIAVAGAALGLDALPPGLRSTLEELCLI